MPQITLLPDELINKIAAGEVIERPASVVKELLENALDAGASTIHIEIKDYGKELIKVSDNGMGMDPENAKIAVLRHATSKIKNEEDLFSIHTLGFRGEALASIAAVSKLRLTTKDAQSSTAYQLYLEGGLVKEEKITAAEQGTVMEVHHLFWNTPARKKFLKTDAVELQHILEVVMRYAVVNPTKAFKLCHEGKELLYSPAIGDHRGTIAALYGIHQAKNLLEVNYSTDAVAINGFIAKPSEARNDKNLQLLFVNNRWVKNDEIMRAVYEAYHAMLFVNKHPSIFLFLTLDPAKIDVNVHPAKTTIKIEQNEQVCAAVSQAVQATLRRDNLIPTVEVEFSQSYAPKNVKYHFEPSTQTVLQVRESDAAMFEEAPIPKIPFSRAANTFPPLRLLGQIHKTFFVAETPGGVFFIDQHAAHERVVYETFMEQCMDKEVAVQQLLQGELVELSAAEKMLWKEHKTVVEELGFRIEPFGENTFVLKTIPLILGRLQGKEMFLELLQTLQEGRKALREFQETIVTRMACRAAVMAGEVVTNSQMEQILKELATKKDPYTCPHGRPVMIKTEAEELEKKFKRKG